MDMKNILTLAILLLSAARAGAIEYGMLGGAAGVAGTSISPASVTISNLGVGGVVFSSTPAAGRLSVDASNLFWDDTNNRLGVGNAAPATPLDVTGISQFGTTGKSTFSATGALSVANGANITLAGASLVSGGGASLTYGVVASTAVIGGGASGDVTSEIRITGGGGAPPTSGSSGGNTRFRIGASDANVLDFGNYAAAPFSVWLQGNSRSDFTTQFPIVFNPNGGSIGIGTASPATKLHMSSGTLTIDGTSPGLIIGSPSAVTRVAANIATDQSLNTSAVIRAVDAATGKVAQFSHNGTDVLFQSSYLGGAGASGLRFGYTTAGGVNVDGMVMSNTGALSIFGVLTSSTTQGTASVGTQSATCTNQHCTLTPGAVTAVTYTFGTAWPKVPDCVALTNAATPLALSITAVSVNALTITSGTALTGNTVTFICMGAP